MGASTKEKGVLKLVHPGRHVEYHRRSITAAEIMRKNPRHCIARPDFFKNPYIVVHPESVLVPGQVFYIVPNKTIYRLLKDRSKPSDRRFSQENESPNTSDFQLKPYAGRTPMRQFSQEQERSSCRNSVTEAEVNEKNNNIYQTTSRESSVASEEGLTFQARDYYLNRKGSALEITKNDNQQKRTHKQITKLKSCMKKEGSVRASLNLKVTFDWNTTIISRMEELAIVENLSQHSSSAERGKIDHSISLMFSKVPN